MRQVANAGSGSCTCALATLEGFERITQIVLPDLIGLREDERKRLDHQQLVSLSKEGSEPAAALATKRELRTCLTFS